MSDIKKLNKILLKPTEKLEIKLSVGILNNKGEKTYYSLFDTGRDTYLTSDPSSNIVMTLKDSAWDSQKSLYINKNNIAQLIEGLNDMYIKLKRKDLYIIHPNGEMELGGITSDDEVFLTNLKFNQCLKIEPAIIYDADKKPLQGVYMYINRKDNIVDLSIDEFQSIVILFNKVDIGLETQGLINMHILEEIRELLGTKNNKSKNDENKRTFTSGKTSIFAKKGIDDNIDRYSKESVKSSVGGIIPKTLEDL